MLIRGKKNQTIAAGAQTGEGIGIQGVVFAGLICFLLIWSFWGTSIEQKMYGRPLLPHASEGDLGAEIIVSRPDSISADLIVGRVYPNSAAELAGLKTGDRIAGIDNRMFSSLDMAVHLLGAHRRGTPLKLTVIRNSRSREIYIPRIDWLSAARTLKVRSLSRSGQVTAIVVYLVLTALMFFYFYRNIESRTHIVLFFAAAVVLAGVLFRIYDPVDAFFAIKFKTISLLLGMGIVSAVLGEAGFFDCVAYRIHKNAGRSRLKILILFCLLTYLFSLAVNNLTTILVVVPMTLNLSAIVGFDPRPVIIGEVISSNIGGASTMIGDFPNMLISAEAGIGFNQFIVFMMPICMIILGIVLIFLTSKSVNSKNIVPKKNTRILKIVKPRLTERERKALRKSIFVLCLIIILFAVSELISVTPPAIALLGGVTLFLFSGVNRRAIVNQVGFNDILFFTGLFIVVGSLEACGFLQYISSGITVLSLGKPWLLCLVLMWAAAFLTAFLSAGPTTALFFPIILGIGMTPPHHIIWWSLSLGVLAGSSATIVGATAGPVATSLVENFSSRHQLGPDGINTITYQQFARIGVPAMFLILAASSIYILCLCMVL